MSLLCQKQFPDAKIPQRKNVENGGFDVFAYLDDHPDLTATKLNDTGCILTPGDKTGGNESKTILLVPPGCRVCIPIGVALQCPADTAFQVWPRSGLAVDKGIDILAGLIDSGYRNEVKVVLINHSNQHVKITHGEKVAQLVPVRLNHGSQLMFQDVPSLDMSQRGLNGFGSSGNF